MLIYVYVHVHLHIHTHDANLKMEVSQIYNNFLTQKIFLHTTRFCLNSCRPGVCQISPVLELDLSWIKQT